MITTLEHFYKIDNTNHQIYILTCTMLKLNDDSVPCIFLKMFIFEIDH